MSRAKLTEPVAGPVAEPVAERVTHTVGRVELWYTSASVDRPVISGPEVAADLFRKYIGRNMEMREEFWVIAVNNRNRYAGHTLVGAGSIHGTVACPRYIAQFAMLTNAAAVIVGHNHPSGGTSPSPSDTRLTETLRDGLALLDVVLLDSLVLTASDYFSMEQGGAVPFNHRRMNWATG